MAKAATSLPVAAYLTEPTKPKEKKEAEAAQFEQQIEDAIRSVISSGQTLTKTAVAKLLCGGVNPNRLVT